MSARVRRLRPRKRLNQREIQLKKNILKAVKTLPEPRNHYTSQVTGNVGWSGTIVNLFNPAQGDTSQQRDGDRCTMTHVSVRGRVTSSTTVDSYNAVRIILFIWKPDSAEREPAMDDILQASYANSTETPFSPIVVGQEAKDLIVLSDRTYKLALESERTHIYHINKKLNRKVFFNDGATTGQGQLYLCQVSDDGATSYPQSSFVSNVTFKVL